MAENVADEPIAALRAMLSPDGYDLIVADVRDDEVDLDLVAGPDACAECLVPEEVFAEIAALHLAPSHLRLGRLTYPAGSAAH